MDLALDSRPLQLKAVAVFLFVLVFVGASVSGLEVGDSSGNAVVSVEQEIRAMNLGTNNVFEVYLENGSTVSYEKYTSHHPLCPEQPEKCGEDSVDPGWGEVQETVNSSDFREVEEDVFRPSRDICMVSRTSFEAC